MQINLGTRVRSRERIAITILKEEFATDIQTDRHTDRRILQMANVKGELMPVDI
jgi:hypothetical protein